MKSRDDKDKDARIIFTTQDEIGLKVLRSTANVFVGILTSFLRPELRLHVLSIHDDSSTSRFSSVFQEWLTSLKQTHKNSLQMLSSMAKKAGKIYGTANEPAKQANQPSPGPTVHAQAAPPGGHNSHRNGSN